MIIGLVGEKFAGKDTAANYLTSKYNAGHFRFSHILDAILEELNLEISRKNEVNLGLALRKVFGDHVLINALEQRVRHSISGYQVVNGIRMDELPVVKSWGAKVIYITAPVETRFLRFQQRKEKADDGEMDLENFKQQEQEGPTEMAIPELGKQADFKIDNIGTLEQLYEKMDRIMKKLA